MNIIRIKTGFVGVNARGGDISNNLLRHISQGASILALHDFYSNAYPYLTIVKNSWRKIFKIWSCEESGRDLIQGGGVRVQGRGRNRIFCWATVPLTKHSWRMQINAIKATRHLYKELLILRPTNGRYSRTSPPEHGAQFKLFFVSLLARQPGPVWSITALVWAEMGRAHGEVEERNMIHYKQKIVSSMPTTSLYPACTSTLYRIVMNR